MQKMNKKGQVNTLTNSILAIVLAGIVLVFGIVMSQELRDTQTSGTDAYAAANKTLIGLSGFSDFWPLIILAVVIGVVLAIVLGVFGGRKR